MKYLKYGNINVSSKHSTVTDITSLHIKSGVWSSGMILALGDDLAHQIDNTNMREALGSIPSSPLFFKIHRQMDFLF